VLAITALTMAGPARAGVDLARVDPTSVATCDRLVAAYPDDSEAYRCYLLIARRHQRWGEAAQRLDALLALDANNHRARLALGSLEADRFRTRAEGLLRDAAEGFAGRRDPSGEVRARLSLANHLQRRGRGDDAEAETDRAAEVAEAEGDPELQARVGMQRAWNAYRRDDYATALVLFNKLETDLAPDAPARLRADLWGGMGAVAWAIGRHDEAFEHYRRAVEQSRRIEDAYMESGDLYNMALLAARLREAGKMSLAEVRELIHAAVATARRGGNHGAEAAARLLLAQDPLLEIAERIPETEKALELTRQIGDTPRACFALRLLAHQLATHDAEGNKERAFRLLDEALDLARSVGSLPDVARGYIVRAGMYSSTRPKDEVVADYLAAIDTIEKIRDLQWDELVRARSLWNWAFLYYRLSGGLLEPVDRQPAPEDANLAFMVVERLRARILLDTMDAAHATDVVTPEGDDRSAHRRVLEQIAAVQRDLLSPGLSEQEAAAALAQLERLELDEAELRDRIARSEPSYALLRLPEIPTIEEVQGQLAPDQAMVAFHLSTREISDTQPNWNGGSWVFAITRDRVTVVPLPDKTILQDRIPVFLGLLARRDQLEIEAAVRLYEDLLEEALDQLPPGINRLVVIPDGVLHRLPFGALRRDASDDPLATRFEIGTAPSATLWRHWKRLPAPSGRDSVLALADPKSPSSRGASEPEGATRLATEREMHPLPHALDEARELVRSMGGDGRLVTGHEASERFVKTVDLDRFGILHFAAHAVVDDRNPQRSAVLLAPGAPQEDGLLQMREVVTLDLDGQVVILSACSSASGELTEGEGVVGLARAFFQAGARAVVGSLWPLRDAEAAELVEDLARHLGRGESVGGALTLASRARIEAHAPTATWAGLVVLGDADVVPLPGGRHPSSDRLPLFLVAFALVAIGLVLVLRLRKLRSV
jgi:CHAT domain-containing protein